MQTRYDLAIVGAGPAGLACAILASNAGFTVCVVEREAEAALVAPPRDGRDIALTHRSMSILKALGVWDRFPADEVAPIRRAAVRNGPSGDLLSLDTANSGADALGFLVGNSVIRAEIYAEAKRHAGIELVCGVGVKDVELGANLGKLILSDGRRIEADLVVAADSRFSETRRRAGIGADMRDFGRTCIVCRMKHEKPHDLTAIEWFDLDRTLAALPLNNNETSIVLTIAAAAAPEMMAMSAAEYAADIERRFKGEWGHMELTGERHVYPLVAVYAHRFYARRFALVGDAAVGMHPVTAHGFNFGLRGAETLVSEMKRMRAAGSDFGSEAVLKAYDSAHRRATYPLYVATNAMVGLYTDASPLAQLARNALLRLGNGISPIKSFMVHKLTEIDAPQKTLQ